ncbi:MAG: TonB C-terminal domain-containing protein [Myxococcota bacterium]
MKSALDPDPQPLWTGIGCSVFLHGGLGGFAFLVSWLGPLFVALFPSCQPDPPLISDSVEVSVVSAKRLNVPDKAERAKRRKKPTQPVPKKTPEPEPVKESDLVVKTEKTPEPEPEGNVEDFDAERQRALEELLREEALSDLLADAPEGEVDRLPTNPDGDPNADPALAALGTQATGDPAVARWKLQVTSHLRERFKPVGATEGLMAIVYVWFDPRTGDIERWKVAKGSGVLSFDKAAERAIAAAGTIPKPPPAYEALFDVEYVEVEMVP